MKLKLRGEERKIINEMLAREDTRIGRVRLKYCRRIKGGKKGLDLVVWYDVGGIMKRVHYHIPPM